MIGCFWHGCIALSITAKVAVIERAMQPCQKQPIMPPGPRST